MCTVTIVPHDRGVRVTSNRDELRLRPAALSPRIYDLDGRLAAFPLDPQGGGTWVGVNDAGLIVALLNRNDTPRTTDTPRSRRPRSRGLIARDLLRHGSVSDALATAARLDPTAFEPFRIVTVRSGLAGTATSDSERITCKQHALEGPLMFTSSSLGDDLVERPRRRLFERLVAGRARDWLDGQIRFHRHQWSRHPEISVRMARADAMTVSQTVVEVARRGSGLLYEAAPGGQPRHGARTWCSLL